MNFFSKTNTKQIIGAAGVREILEKMAEAGHDTRTVCIGGINESNLQRIYFQSAAMTKSLDGVAVVSAIMAASDPQAASRKLLGLFNSPPPFHVDLGTGPMAWDKADAEALVAQVPSVIKTIHETNPLSHNMTNLVGVPPPSFFLFFLKRGRLCRTLRQMSPLP
jgi:thiamine-phosphate diphosphorylase/hydroxyethylthiazole kinase